MQDAGLSAVTFAPCWQMLQLNTAYAILNSLIIADASSLSGRPTVGAAHHVLEPSSTDDYAAVVPHGTCLRTAVCLLKQLL